MGKNEKSILEFFLKLFNLTLIITPIFILVYFVLKYHVDAPFIDQWSLIPYLEKFYQGNLSLGDLFRQHNEHRIFFPLILMIALAHISKWIITYEVITNIFLAVCLFGVIAYQVQITLKNREIGRINWLLPGIALFVFSLTQWQNWLWGWQIQIFLSVLMVVSGICFLSNPPITSYKLFGAIISGIIATYSFANGSLLWGIGLLILFFSAFENNRIKRVFILFWILIGSGVIFLYYFGYHSLPHHPPLTLFLKHPLQFIQYVCNYLGGAVGGKNAFVIGLGGLAIWITSILFLINNQKVKIKRLIPYIAMGLYSIGSAFLTGIARSGFGALQALSSRYVTISNLFWVSIISLLFIILKGSNIKTPKYQKYLFSLSFFLILALNVQGSLQATKSFAAWNNWLKPARQQLIAKEKNWIILSRLCPNQPYLIKERIPILIKHNLSVYRKK
ncbi:MAG: hypothetical protein HQ564_02185 [Candidatus Saganbacteria bacterium]|nr:hypothetical protein [Candidatus Saganbacteria bacterium]